MAENGLKILAPIREELKSAERGNSRPISLENQRVLVE
jgi:hypothetical protein